MIRRDFLASAASISILPTDDPGISRVIADEIREEAPPPMEYVTTPEIHGSINAAVSDASKNASLSVTGRGVVELVPGRKYIVRTENGSRNNQAPCILAESNVEIRTAGKPHLGANQAIIQFESWAGKSGVHNQTLIKLEDVSNFVLGWLTLDGNKNTIDGPGSVDYSQGQNGGIHCITVYGDCTNCTLKELSVGFSLTDGLMIRGTVNGWLVEDCILRRNRRQGASLIKMGLSGGGEDQNIFRRCAFNGNGDFPDDVPGNRPGAGVDCEADQTSDNIYGLTFDNCDFFDNRGSAWNNGVDLGTLSSGRGLVFDMKASVENVKILNCRCTQNRENFALVMRDAATFNQMRIDGLECSDGANNRLNVYAAGSKQGHITNSAFIDCNVPEIFFHSSVPATGHSVTVWKGSHNPKITHGHKTITVKDGLP